MMGSKCFLLRPTKKFSPKNREKTKRGKLMKWASKNTAHVGLHLQRVDFFSLIFSFSVNVLALFIFLVNVLASFFFSFFLSLLTCWLFFFLDFLLSINVLAFFFFFFDFVWTCWLLFFFSFFNFRKYFCVNFLCFFFNLMNCPFVHNFFKSIICYFLFYLIGTW